MKISIILLALMLLLSASSANAVQSGMYLVREVIDGDTIVLDNGATVRYIGIDTPEVNEPFYQQARIRNMALVLGKLVKVIICGPEPVDRYGRTLAWVHQGDIFVNAELIKEGLARAMIVPPCALPKEKEFLGLEMEARSRRLGIWSGAGGFGGITPIKPEDAMFYVGKTVTVTATVASVRTGERAWFLEFGDRFGFKAVIPVRVVSDMRAIGMDPAGLVGRTVNITGTVTEYRGQPEIRIDTTTQIR